MEATVILRKVRPSGAKIEVTFDRYSHNLVLSVNEVVINLNARIRQFETPTPTGYTHVVVTGEVMVGFTPEEVETIKGFQALVIERRRLVGAWESAQNHEFNARESAYEAEQGRPNFVNHEASLVTAAFAAVQAFDAAHPQIAPAVKI